MKSVFKLTLSLAFLLPAAYAAASDAAITADFGGAVPQPLGTIDESVSQLRVRFPGTILKKDALKVVCTPSVGGYSSWADNNTLWTYNFKAQTQDDTPKLVGGSKCTVTQTEELKAVDGKTWPAGTIQYDVMVSGPNVVRVLPAHGFKGTLRESESVVMVIFDGPVDRNKFFAEQNGYISYLSANAPGEKMPLVAVPSAQEKDLFADFKRTQYIEIDYKDTNWILGTIQQNLIAGSQVTLNIQGQTSAQNSGVHADKKYSEDFTVRSHFEAQISCDNPTGKGVTCLPHSPVSVVFNGKVKWPDVKDAYIEYVPYKSTDHKPVRSYPELAKDQDNGGIFNSILNSIGNYVPFVAKFSDTLVESITFDVNIEPQTLAKVVIPSALADIDGRKLSNAIAEFHIRIGSMSEEIQVPQQISFFEKNVPKLYLPVGVVNLNQSLKIRKVGKDTAHWEPIRDVNSMIQIIRAYAARGDYRASAAYVSPLETLGVTSNVSEIKLKGHKNRDTWLQFPFGAGADSQVGGFYPIEVSSATYEAEHSNSRQGEFFNPKYVLAQVTNLAVHLKKGDTHTVAWVTTLSDAQPVAGAQLEVYNCLGQSMKTVTTDSTGIASFANQEWAKDCQKPKDVYSEFYQPENFYVIARSGSDFTLVHSSWTSSSNSVYGAPGIGYFDTPIVENQPTFHSVIGVNLVKPGQKVPVQVIAKLPESKGFSEVAASQLPHFARIVSADDQDVYYEFPLQWQNGTAQFEWPVPADASVKLGRYAITLIGGGKMPSNMTLPGDIEVAEFKVPLMSGLIAFPNQALVQPSSIPINSVIRYANGTGAKNLSAELSYYFRPTAMRLSVLKDFAFGTGPVTLTDDDSGALSDALPTNARPAVIDGLKTAADGSLVKDLALEKAADGRTIAEVLKTVTRPQSLVVRVRYQDQMGEYQTLSQAKDIYNAIQYVGTNLVTGTRADAQVRAAVITVDGKIITDMSDLQLKVVRVETKIIGEEIYGGLIKNTVERELKPVRWSGGCSLVSQVATCAVGDLKEGSYAFEATSTSAQQTSHTLFKVDSQGRVYGNEDYFDFGDGEENRQLPLALDKKGYKDGDKAVVSFSAPFKTCNALVSVERNDVIESFVVGDACSKGFVQVPIDGSFAPNAYVSVYAITGRVAGAGSKVGEKDFGRPTYRLGFANMKVDWGHFKSTVGVKTDKVKYMPGDNVNVDVSVQADEGSLANGTVTLVAIEEKILELKPNDTYAVLDALMQMRGHSVDTVTALERIETVITNNADIGGKSARKGGDEGGDGSSKSEFKRKLFDALVTFQAGVPVVKGVAKFSFKTNDSVTRFKIFAIATDSNQKFGTGTAEYLTEKDTQSYSNIPLVSYTGDSYPVRVTIQNNGGKPVNYRAEVTAVVKDAQGNVIDTKKLTKQVTIDNAGSQAVEVGQLTVSDDADHIEYAVRVYDANGNLVDSMEPPAQVILPSVPLAVHDAYVLQVDTNSMRRSLSKETDALPGKGQIRAVLAKSLVTGSLAQIVSRMDRDPFADFFIESKVYKALLKSSAANPDALKKVLGSLMGYLDSDGFVKYYPQAASGSIRLTADLLNVLQSEPWAMKVMPSALKAKLKNAVSLVLTKSVSPDLVGRSPMHWFRAQTAMGRAAFAFGDASLEDAARAVNSTFAAELKQNPAALGTTTDKWTNSELVNYWLLQVYSDPASAKNSETFKQLSGPSRLSYTGNMAQLNGGPVYTYFYSDETIETSNLLFGLARLKGDKDLARALAVGLVNASVKAWYVDETLAATAMGLKGFGRAYEAETVNGSALLSVPEQSANATVSWDQSDSAKVITAWTQNTATVQVTHSGQGHPWLSIEALTAVPLTAPRAQGISIDKSVRDLTHPSGYQLGDIIEVTLNLQASSLVAHVAINDPIPAGSNILAEAYGDFSSGEKSYSGYKLYFAELPQGLSTVKYQYQLNNPGTFKLPPTRAEGLYMPGVFAEVPNATLTVN